MLATGQRLRRNAFGPYYVTDDCNGCGLCQTYAPCNFERSDDGSYYYLVQQPYDDFEEDAVREAADVCPAQAIRSDGDGF